MTRVHVLAIGFNGYPYKFQMKLSSNTFSLLYWAFRSFLLKRVQLRLAWLNLWIKHIWRARSTRYLSCAHDVTRTRTLLGAVCVRSSHCRHATTVGGGGGGRENSDTTDLLFVIDFQRKVKNFNFVRDFSTVAFQSHKLDTHSLCYEAASYHSC